MRCDSTRPRWAPLPLLVGALAVLCVATVPAAAQDRGTPDGEWRYQSADAWGTRYSPLSQINADNFGELEQAWLDPLLVQGDDELGALAKIHEQLQDANVRVYASSGVTGGGGHYGYVIYIRPDEYEIAAAALGI